MYLKRWLNANKISLNTNKTNYMIFHSPGAELPVNAAIKIGNRFISRVKYTRFLYGLGSNRYLGAKLWNELPREIKTSSSKFVFKKQLQKHLLEIM